MIYAGKDSKRSCLFGTNNTLIVAVTTTVANLPLCLIILDFIFKEGSIWRRTVWRHVAQSVAQQETGMFLGH